MKTFCAMWILLLSTLAVAAAERPAVDRVLLFDCVSDIGHRKLAFYDDGTIYLQEGEPGEEETLLHRLDPDRAQAFLTRLRQETKPGTMEPSNPGPEGAWVERCLLQVDLPGEPQVRLSFRRYDTLPLSLSRLVAVADDLLAALRDAPPEQALPAEYEPRPGDVLRRKDGLRFEIVRTTGDGRGLELQGIDQPLTVYVPVGAVHLEFTELLSRERP